MLMNNNEYIEIIETIKGEIRGAQYKAALSVNRELIMLYYHIGTVINEHKTWGSNGEKQYKSSKKYCKDVRAVGLGAGRHIP